MHAEKMLWGISHKQRRNGEGRRRCFGVYGRLSLPAEHDKRSRWLSFDAALSYTSGNSIIFPDIEDQYYANSGANK